MEEILQFLDILKENYKTVFEILFRCGNEVVLVKFSSFAREKSIHLGILCKSQYL